MYVIGTAGHVDHGKSTLVAALTGIDPDRLKEEKDREMTIDLGFAWLKLTDEIEIGIIDVPGHRDFIENMLAGVGGIDTVIFVIAADEGVMAQTREHLAIIDLLQIKSGVIALTKSDLISDPEWFDLLEEDIRETVKDTVLAEAPIVRVSAKTGFGLQELKELLVDRLKILPGKPDLGRPRLPVDRVFSIAGFGTVLTGTLLDGHLNTGDEVVVLPANHKGRVRTIQNHKRKAQSAYPGSRTAVNISGVDVQQVKRGDILVTPGHYELTNRLDVQFRLLKDASMPLEHNTHLKLYLGSAEIPVRSRLIGSEKLLPGDTGWLQLELESNVVAVRGDHYILRRPSPGETLGGGIVLNTRSPRRYKRFSSEVIKQYETFLEGTPAEMFLHALDRLQFASVSEVISNANLAKTQTDEILAELEKDHLIMPLEKDGAISYSSLITSSAHWNAIKKNAELLLGSYHQQFKLRPGMAREEFKSRLGFQQKIFNLVLSNLISQSVISEDGAVLKLPGHEIIFTPAQKARADDLLGKFAAEPYAPPSVKECEAMVGEALLSGLIETGQLIQVADDVLFRKHDYDEIYAEIIQKLQNGEQVTVAVFRDHYHTSRKYALGFLEYLDRIGVTERDGDNRRLRKSSHR